MSARGDGLLGWRRIRAVVCLVVAVYALAPLLTVLVMSFSAAPYLAFPPTSFSLRWYRSLIENPAWVHSLRVTAEVSLPTAVLATLLGAAAAYALVRSRVPGAALITGFLALPVVVPTIIVAAGMFAAFRTVGLIGTIGGLIIGHTVLATPYVVATVSAALRTLDTGLEYAAATLGASPWATFRRITLPLVLPAILSGAVFALVISLDELIVSLFISTARVRPVTVQMWSDLRGDVDPTVTAIATLFFVISLALLALDSVLRRDSRAGGATQALGEDAARGKA